MRFAGWELDIARRMLTTPEGAGVRLTLTECAFLRVLLDHANRVVTRDMLLDFQHNTDSKPANRAADMVMSRLRRKLDSRNSESSIIKTVRDSGYILAAIVETL